MWRQLDLVAAAAIGLLVGACGDNRPTLAGPTQTTARHADVDEGNGVPSTAADYDAAVPIAYYQLSLDFTKHTAGFTPPVQARAFGYMGLALYESVVAGMPESVGGLSSGGGVVKSVGPDESSSGRSRKIAAAVTRRTASEQSTATAISRRSRGGR